jgi:glycosyltransferase involved in cell wall biosynthesis
MRVAVKSPNGRWIIDDIVSDYKKHTKHQIVGLSELPDVFWCANTFSFPHIRDQIPPSCKSYLQLHHINEEQLDEYNFEEFNKANGCIVPNKITEILAKKHLSIPICRLPYWILSRALIPTDKNKIEGLRKELNPENKLLIGSFVKDGNGKIGETPKIAKNPNLLINALELINKQITGGIKVVLAGYSRKYVVVELSRRQIPFVYLERYSDINSLYDILDYYISTSKFEGGPQSVLEASYRKVKILSTPVGLAPEILHSNCLCQTAEEFVNAVTKNIDEREFNYQSVQAYLPEKIVPRFDELFETGGRNGS